jgi:hypothetical protein
MRLVIKASGEQEEFNSKKFRRSLLRVGASEQDIDKLIKDVEENKDLVTTHDIYKYAFNYLSRIKASLASRYNIKNAIFQLGPSGFPFELFLSKFFESLGYQTVIGRKLLGKCVTHEVDVVLKKDNNFYIVESKFHNAQGIKSDVKITLYIQARFLDINADGHKEFYKAWAVTNTRFTSDAIQYANCVGMNIMDWNYPHNKSLSYFIDKLGLHPVTTLVSLSSKQKKDLINNNIILCKQIIEDKNVLKILKLSDKKIDKLITEAQEVVSAFKN